MHARNTAWVYRSVPCVTAEWDPIRAVAAALLPRTGLGNSSTQRMSRRAHTCMGYVNMKGLCACVAGSMGLFNWFFTWVRAMPVNTSDCMA